MNPVDWRNLPDTSLPVPAGQYHVFIRSVGTAPSKKGSAMATLELEILHPTSVVEAGSTIQTAGRTFRHWMVFGVNPRSYRDAEVICKAYLPDGQLPSPVDPNDMPNLIKTLCEGKVMPAVQLSSEARYRTDSAGNQILNPATGQPELLGYNTILKSPATAVDLQTLGLTAPPPRQA